MTVHSASHAYAGQTVPLVPVDEAIAAKVGLVAGDFRIEDYWDRVSGNSWYDSGVWAALNYASRSGLSGLPFDDEVVYGKTKDGLGHIVHVTELVVPA